MAKYLACGNVLYDSMREIDGSSMGEHMGGQALYATSGIRVWTRDVKMVTNCGYDFDDAYKPWLLQNGLRLDGINYEQEFTAHVGMQHTESGAYKMIPSESGLIYNEYLQGMMELSFEQIEAQIDSDTKAIYFHVFIPDRVYFRKIDRIREKFGVRFMYEVVYGMDYLPYPYFNVDKLKDAVKIAGLWSLNKNEAVGIFNMPNATDEQIIEKLLEFDCEMCYFRCGDRGAYVVIGNTAYFVPVVHILPSADPTGCGNCSTGAAMAAWCETDGNPLMTGVMAGISAGFNASQAGPWPLYTEEDEAEADRLANELYEKLRKIYKEIPAIEWKRR
ncbi:MAG: carbohydrate kinase family protein [Oscillospiraceae bacterium]|nr:carbohydrate kinase family protein [Oscillospiraceae bacterium]